jgi:hypothetical protein
VSREGYPQRAPQVGPSTCDAFKYTKATSVAFLQGNAGIKDTRTEAPATGDKDLAGRHSRRPRTDDRVKVAAWTPARGSTSMEHRKVTL